MVLIFAGADETLLPCPAWVESSLSNVRAAKDASWFSDDYTPFESYLETGHLGQGQRVRIIGVGTVDLPVRLGPDQHGILRLKNVLHVPDMICNIVGYLYEQGYAVLNTKIVDISTGETVVYLVK